MSSEKGPKHIYVQGHKFCYYYYQFERHRENKNRKLSTKQSEQSRECLQVEWLSFYLSENTQCIERNWLKIIKLAI